MPYRCHTAWPAIKREYEQNGAEAAHLGFDDAKLESCLAYFAALVNTRFPSLAPDLQQCRAEWKTWRYLCKSFFFSSSIRTNFCQGRTIEPRSSFLVSFLMASNHQHTSPYDNPPIPGFRLQALPPPIELSSLCTSMLPKSRWF